jgi:hypothetical protein
MTEDIMFWMDVLGKLMDNHKSCKYHSDFIAKSMVRLDTGEVHEFTLIAIADDSGFKYRISVALDENKSLLCFERVDGLKCSFKVHIVPSLITHTVKINNLLIRTTNEKFALTREVRKLQERNKQLESKLAAIQKLF